MKIFVLGTGRSGTHWVGQILDEHPDIRATIESPTIFKFATRAAIWKSRRWMYLPLLRVLYAREARQARPKHYADKSHPVIWYADTLAAWFPDAKFVGLNRSPFGTVASMLQHEHVSRWQREWEKFGVPNEFLGITSDNAPEYAQMSSASRAALRWKSHQARMDVLRAKLGDRLLVLDYEKMIDDFDVEVDRLWSFLSLSPADVSAQAPKVESRDNWRRQLTDEQISDVAAISGVKP